MLFKSLFGSKKLINWKRPKPKTIELFRHNIEQNIIDNFGDSTFSYLDKNFKNEKLEKKIIINIESGYSKWVLNFIKKHKKDLNNFSIFNLDLNNTSDYYLECLADIENEMKQDFIDLGTYCKLKEDTRIFPDESVYFVYQKNMITVFNNRRWKIMIDEIFRILKNGCMCEFIEYDFRIKNVNSDSISYKINNYLEEKIDININDIIDKINKKFLKCKIKPLKMPLYEEIIFQGSCIENVFMGYSHFEDSIIKMLFKKYNIVFNSKDLKEHLLYEWNKNESYIELYIISATKYI